MGFKRNEMKNLKALYKEKRKSHKKILKFLGLKNLNLVILSTVN